jgi:hypothetical protein
MNSNYDAFAASIAGLYLLGVTVNGNGQALYTEITNQAGFLKWAGALMVILILNRTLELGDFGKLIIVVVFVGMGLQLQGSGGLDQIKQIFGSGGNVGSNTSTK